MQRYAPRTIPPILSFVAGYVDSCTFLALFGLFVAQVTGSFVLTGTQFVMQKPGVVIKLAEIFAFFLSRRRDHSSGWARRTGGPSPFPRGACARSHAADRPISFVGCGESIAGARYPDCPVREP